MREVLAVMLLNFKQGIREKVFYGVCFFFVFFLGVCLLLGLLAPGEDTVVLRSAGLAGMEFSCLALLIFSMVFTFYREKDSRILEVYLTDFGRDRYLAGKLGGYFLIGFFYILISGAGLLLLLLPYGAFSFAVAAAFFTLFLKVAIVITACLIFCCLFSSPVISLLCGVFFYLSAELSYSALKMVIFNGGSGPQILASKAVYYLLPNLTRLDLKSMAAHGRVPDPGFFIIAAVYSVAYIVFLWFICRFVFEKKEY